MLARTFSDEELATIVAVARSAGKRVSAHAHGDEGIAAAARAGVDTIEHATFATVPLANREVTEIMEVSHHRQSLLFDLRLARTLPRRSLIRPENQHCAAAGECCT